MPTQSWNDMVKADKDARTPAPAGRYVLEVVKADLGNKKDHPDIPQWRLLLQVAEGAQKGKSVWLRLTFDFTSNAGTMAFEQLRKLGIDPGAHDMLKAESKTVFIGKRVEAELSVRDYNGSPTNDLKTIIKPLTSGVPSGVGGPPPKTAPAAPSNPLAKPKAI